jgi:hypothetical protein
MVLPSEEKMDTTTAAITSAAVTALVAIASLSVTHVLTAKRESQARLQEMSIKYVESQIAELYGPMYSLIQQIFNAWYIRRRLLRDSHLSEQDRQQIRQFMYAEYFRPIHERMREVLMTKLYLVDGQVPESFWQYLEHSNQDLVQGRLSRELGIATDGIAGVRWPSNLDHDVRASLDRLTTRVRSMRDQITAPRSYDAQESRVPGRPKTAQ